jgi:CBS domain-containing protein
MTHRPTTTGAGELLPVACEILSQRKISELPVVDQAGRPIGLIDITDVVGLAPEDAVSGSKFQVSSHLKSTISRAALRVRTDDDFQPET